MRIDFCNYTLKTSIAFFSFCQKTLEKHTLIISLLGGKLKDTYTHQQH